MTTTDPASLVRRHPSAVLLAAQLLAVLAYPFLDSSTLGRALLGLVGTLIVLLALWAVRRTPVLSWVALLLGVPAMCFTVVEAFNAGTDWIVLVNALLHAPFYFYVSYAMIRYLFHDNRVTRDELYATGAAFTVVAWGFAYVYAAAQVVWPGSFAGTGGGGRPDVVRAAVPVVHDADQRRALRRGAGAGPRPLAGRHRAGRGGPLRRDGGLAAGRTHRGPQPGMTFPTCTSDSRPPWRLAGSCWSWPCRYTFVLARGASGGRRREAVAVVHRGDPAAAPGVVELAPDVADVDVEQERSTPRSRPARPRGRAPGPTTRGSAGPRALKRTATKTALISTISASGLASRVFSFRKGGLIEPAGHFGATGGELRYDSNDSNIGKCSNFAGGRSHMLSSVSRRRQEKRDNSNGNQARRAPQLAWNGLAQ